MARIFSPSRTVWISSAGASVLLLGLLYLPLFHGGIHGGPDLTQNDFPTRILYAHGLKHGRLTLWNPQLFRGYRLHGEGQTGMCHPWHLLLYALLPPAAALWLDLTIAFPLAFAGLFLFLRRWRFSCPGAVFGAAAWVFGSYFFAHFGHMSLLLVHAHLPWLLFFIDGCVRRPFAATGAAAPAGTPRRSLAGLAAVTGSMLLLGHPQSTWQVLLAGAVYAVVCADGAFASRERLAAGLRMAAFTALGLLLGMVQVLPTLAALRGSPRGCLGPGMRYNFSLHPANLIQFFDPFFFADTTVGNGLVPGPGLAPVYNNNSAEFSVYGGVALLCLIVAVWGAYHRHFLTDPRRRLALFFFLLGAFGALLALGRRGGLFVLFGAVPVLREFRCAGRYIGFVQLAGAGLGAFALDGWLRQRRRPLPWRTLLPIPALVLALALAGTALQAPLADTWFAPSAWPRQLAGPAFALAAVLLLRAGRKFSWVPALLAALCLADLGNFGLRIVLPVDDIRLEEIRALYQAYEHPPAVNRELRLYAPANSGVWKGFYLANGYCGMPPEEPLEQDGDPRRALRLASVGMIWTPQGWKNLPDPLPRFRLVGHIVYDMPENRDADVRTTARLSDSALPLPAVHPGPGRVRVQRETPDELVLEVETKTAQVLVCSDRFDPDWQAAVDGVPTRLLPLYHRALRGVVVPPGRHEVRLAYRSRAFRAGAGLTAAGLLALIAVYAGLAARGRQKGSPCSAS